MNELFKIRIPWVVLSGHNWGFGGLFTPQEFILDVLACSEHMFLELLKWVIIL